MADEDRDVLARLVEAQLDEQRRVRRWKLFFRFAFLGVLVFFAATFVLSPDYSAPRAIGDHAALIKLEGAIFADAGGVTSNNAQAINGSLREAFATADAKLVILEINTPGGSPVQSAYIADEVSRLREAYPDKPLYAVISDICASGGMYVAASAEKVYANPASLIGSIGVVFNGFGFVRAIENLGIERRLMTAGKNKAMLDPFLPEDPEHVVHMQRLLDQIHAQFIEHVKKGRAGKLREDAELFDGLIWTGEKALELGLVDAFGDVRYVAETVGGLEEIVEYTPRSVWWKALSSNLVNAISLRLFELFSYPRLH